MTLTRAQLEDEVVETVEGGLGELIQRLAVEVREKGLFGGDADEALAGELRHAATAEIHSGVLAYSLERRLPQAPPAETGRLARRAAVAGVPLASLLQVYMVAMRFYWESIYDAIHATAGSAELKEEVVRAGTRFLHEFMAQIAAFATSEYADERDRVLRRRTLRRLAVVRDVLAGSVASASALEYDLHGTHRGVVATGAGAEDVAARLSDAARVTVLAVPNEDATWAWASGEPDELGRIARALAAAGGDGLTIGLGRVQRDVDGFRVTHRQALAAHKFARSLGQAVVSHDDIALAALASADPAAAAQLVQDELRPVLGDERRAERLLETLGVYLEHGQNGASAAATLGVSARTVSHRLRAIEAALGRPIATRAAELQMALRLRHFGVGI